MGSVGRSRSVDNNFQAKNNDGAQKWHYQSVYDAMKSGCMLPPVVMYEFLNEYFVFDGHNRVAAAISLGRKFVDAEIIQFLPTTESDARRLSVERANFELKTGIRTIEANRPGVYPRLLQCIEQRCMEFDELITCSSRFRYYADEWHRVVFIRNVGPLIRAGLVNDEYTAADVFLELLERQEMESERAGFDVDIVTTQQLMVEGHKDAQMNAGQRIAQQVFQRADKMAFSIGRNELGLLCDDYIDVQNIDPNMIAKIEAVLNDARLCAAGPM
tara:strand:+ start:4420 stop:5235 length:816 start_codon:yes stop_codon:yes gene_type:complete